MASFTRYLTAVTKAVNEIVVRVVDSSPVNIAQNAIRDSSELRYSPIMPAFLTPHEPPPAVPNKIDSIAFFFANSPYKALGTLKNSLDSNEFSKIYFTEGLASIILLNSTIDRATQLREIIGDCPFEYWPVIADKIDIHNIVIKMSVSGQFVGTDDLKLPSSDDPELRVYVEQIAASLASLWASYGTYFPEERETVRQVTILAKNLLLQYSVVQANAEKKDSDLVRQKKANAIISALVEISAAISYAVTQGTSGSLPILSNRSPFPHHSLLGIGGAIRALTKYTRYIESAFVVRSATMVINSQYSVIRHHVPVSIPKYKSGIEYKFSDSPNTTEEHFDCGGDFRQDDQLPLITHFSLRHGFMESKFSVTAASEALTAETLPQWTLMTLSHEVMHSRVRAIFQALFGKTWDESEDDKIICEKQFENFASWIESRESSQQTEVGSGVRNAILNFCYAIEKYCNPVAEKNDGPGHTVSMDKLNEYYSRHKQMAIEIVVHFHDYYFVYACQPKMYVMSLWASWIKVAAPYARPLEYLTRCLATIACGTGLAPSAAFEHARDILLEGLDALESAGIKSPLFEELRRLVSKDEEYAARAYFYPCYYLIDIVRLFFASRKIASKIDRIENDPFAEGSAFADDYTANIYVYGEGESISPIRYSLATLFKTLSNQSPVDDPQWLTAWNYMVISSQEAKI